MKKNLAYWGLGICTVLATGTIAAGLTPSLAPAAEEFEYTLNPEDGATVKNLRQIEITFSDSDVEFYNNMPNAVLLENTSTGEVYTLAGADLDTFAPDGANTWHLNFAAQGTDDVKDITTDGYYELTIAEGAFVVMDGTSVDKNVQAITAHYSIGYPYTITPSEEGDLSVLNLHFYNGDVEYFQDNNMPGDITLVNKTTGEEYGVAGVDQNTYSQEGGSNWIINLLPEGEDEVTPIVQPGDYELVVKDGAFVIYGEDGSIETSVPGFTWTTRIDGYNYAVAQYVDGDYSSLWINFPTEGIDFADYDAASAVLTNETTGVNYYLAEITEYTRTPQPAGSNWLMNFRPESQEVISPITAPGNYKLTIRKGTFKAASDDVQAINWTSKKAGFVYTIAPVEERNMKALTLHFANETVELADDAAANAYLVNRNTGASYNLAGIVEDTHSTLGGSNWTVTLKDPKAVDVTDITAAGDYELTILRGTFQANGQNVDQIDWSYGILGQDYEISLVKNGDMSELAINFTNKNIEYNQDNNLPNAVVLENTTTGAVYNLAGCDPDTFSTKEGSNWTMHFVAEGEDNVEPIIMPGDYVLHIAEGVFCTFDGNVPNAKVDAIEWTHTVKGYPYEISLVEDANMKSLNIHFDEEGIEYFQNNNMPNAAVLVNTTTGEEYPLLGCEMADRSTLGGSNWIMNFATDGELLDISMPGEYVLTIAEGAFVIMDGTEIADKVQAIEWSYILVETGVEFIPGMENVNSFNVFGVNGTVILRNADRDAVNSLDKGIYIINGVRVMIR